MHAFRSLSRLTLNAWRRTAAAALLALQVVIAVSPVFERQGEVRYDTHTEQQGNRHLFAHDESTCVVCSVRTLAVDAPPAPTTTFLVLASRSEQVAYSAVAPAYDPPPGRHSRAPPVLG